MKIAYFGYDLFYPCLEKLAEANDVEVMKVFSFPEDEDDKNAKIRAAARKYGIEYSEKKVSEDDICALRGLGCNLLVSAGYAYKIPVISDLKGINLHPAYLPEGRGAWPMAQTILKGLKKTGLTVHMLENKFDAGDILLQKEYILKEDETLESLNMWFQNNSADMVYACVSDFYKFYMSRIPQSGGSYWKMPSKEDMTIDKYTTAKKADRILRAFYGSKCFYKDGKEVFNIKKGHISYNGEKKGDVLASFALEDGAYVCAEQFCGK